MRCRAGSITLSLSSIPGESIILPTSMDRLTQIAVAASSFDPQQPVTPLFIDLEPQC